MSSRVNTNPYQDLLTHPRNAPIVFSYNPEGKKGRPHHCPDPKDGPHVPNAQCIKKGHIGYCEDCSHIASTYHGCGKCKNRHLSRIPPSMAATVLGLGINATEAGVNDVVETDEDKENEVTRDEEEKLREKAKLIEEKQRLRETRGITDEQQARQAAIEKFEQERKERQQKMHGKKNFFRGLLRRGRKANL